MSVLECDVERQFLEYCKELEIKCPKLKLASESSWPDRTLLYRGQVMFLELKKPGEKPTPLQQYTLDNLTAAGFYARWSDNLIQMKLLVLDWRRHVDENIRP